MCRERVGASILANVEYGNLSRNRLRGTHTHRRTHARTHARTQARTHAHTHIHTDTHTHTHTHTHAHAHGLVYLKLVQVRLRLREQNRETEKQNEAAASKPWAYIYASIYSARNPSIKQRSRNLLLSIKLHAHNKNILELRCKKKNGTMDLRHERQFILQLMPPVQQETFEIKGESFCRPCFVPFCFFRFKKVCVTVWGCGEVW